MIGATIAGDRQVSGSAGGVKWALVSSVLGGQSVLTFHRATPGALGTQKLETGLPVTNNVAVDVLKELAAKAFGGWIDERLLFLNATDMVWYVPAGVRKMRWQIGAHQKDFTVPWPTLVMCASMSGPFRVFAVKAKGRPTPSEALFHAPLGNFSSAGTMCWGSVEAPSFGMGSRPGFESAVFDTYFSHVNHTQTLTSKKKVGNMELFEFWRALDGAKAEVFPEDRLVSAGGVLRSLC